MKTNLEKYQYYLGLIEAKEKEFIDQNVNHTIDAIYQVYPSGKLTTGKVVQVGYSRKDSENRYVWLGFSGSKPTKDNVRKVKDFYDSNVGLLKMNIGFKYEEQHVGFKTSSTHYLFDDTKNKFLFLNLEHAEAFSAKLCAANEERIQFLEKHKKDASFDYSKNGYVFMGWLNGNEPNQKNIFLECRSKQHMTIEVSHRPSGSENVVSCPCCKIYWKYDSSG